MASRKQRPANQITRWFKLHLNNSIVAMQDLWKQPVATALTVAVIGIALALPGSLNLLIQNGRSLAGGWDSVRDFSVYLQPGSKLESAQEISAELRDTSLISEVTLISADAGLDEFRESSGLNDILTSLDSNPLPHTLVVRPVDDATAEQLSELAATLSERAEVDLVKIDTEWVERLNAILDFLNRVVIMASVLLVVAVIIIVGNTIRLDIQSRRDEIEILKLLGASDGFVRRPFLYIGLWYGLIGGLVALFVLIAGGWLIAAPLERLIGLYETNMNLLGLNWTTAFAMLGGGVLAGWGGAWTAVSRHLAAIQPK
jgi:cell division transport system permease protein